MSYGIEVESCDGCGICAEACPRGAIQITDGAVPTFEVTSLDCNDCGKCAIVCPTRAISIDPAWAVCRGRGCPLTSTRYEGWACTETGQRCVVCGGSLWKPPETRTWVCAACDIDGRVICPKLRKHARKTAAA